MSDNITITKLEYVQLRLDQERLVRLEAGGVDNWDWYSDSLNPADSVSYEDYEAKLKKEIFNHERTT